MDQETILTEALRQVANLCAVAAMTAPKSGGQLFLKGAKPLIETIPICQLRCVDLGIAVGSAAKTASLHNIDTRYQTRIAAAARHIGIIKAELAVALSMSVSHKNIFFDKKMPEVKFSA